MNKSEALIQMIEGSIKDRIIGIQDELLKLDVTEDQADELTQTESQMILKLIDAGHSDNEIAAKLVSKLK